MTEKLLTDTPQGFADRLDTLADDDLHALIAKARSLITARETARRKKALARIKALAKEHGLVVSVAKTRGRSRKTASTEAR